MSFNGLSFVYDGISSESYGLYLASMGGGEDSSSGGMEMDILTKKVARREQSYLMGVSAPAPLEMSLTMFSLKPITRYRLSEIQNWLFCRESYKKLKIIQNDIGHLNYNAILHSSELIHVSNEVYGITCQVTCDINGAWMEEEVLSFPTPSGDLKIENLSDLRYVKPYIEFTFKGGSEIVFTNKSDNNREFSFTGLTNGEVIKVDCDTGEISSSLNINRMGKCNKKFLRLISGINILNIRGSIANLKIIYTPMKKVGG